MFEQFEHLHIPKGRPRSFDFPCRYNFVNSVQQHAQQFIQQQTNNHMLSLKNYNNYRNILGTHSSFVCALCVCTGVACGGMVPARPESSYRKSKNYNTYNINEK